MEALLVVEIFSPQSAFEELAKRMMHANDPKVGDSLVNRMNKLSRSLRESAGQLHEIRLGRLTFVIVFSGNTSTTEAGRGRDMERQSGLFFVRRGDDRWTNSPHLLFNVNIRYFLVN